MRTRSDGQRRLSPEGSSEDSPDRSLGDVKTFCKLGSGDVARAVEISYLGDLHGR